MIVIDASVFVRLVLEPQVALKSSVELNEYEHWIAPEIIDLEVMNAIRKPLLRGEYDEERALMALDAFRSFSIERIATRELSQDIWKLRHNVTPYDAAYVVVANAIGAPLLTCDEKMHNAISMLTNSILV
jgi:predicted nucleic acid-binding protein